MIFTTNSLPKDVIYSFANLFWPKCVEYNEKLFLNDFFDKDAIECKLKEGKSLTEIQYWTNLLEITSLFEDLNYEEAEEFAELVGKLRIM